MTVAGIVMGLGPFAFSVGILATGYFIDKYDVAMLQSLTFVPLVAGYRATTYNNRERRRI